MGGGEVGRSLGTKLGGVEEEGSGQWGGVGRSSVEGPEGCGRWAWGNKVSANQFKCLKSGDSFLGQGSLPAQVPSALESV